MEDTTPAAPVATPELAETPAEIQAKLFKVKVDGQEREVDEAELLRGYSHRAAAEDRMRAANEQRAMAEDVLKIFKENPKLAFQKLGVDAKAFAEQLLNEHLEEEMLSPEQRELKQLRQWQKEQADAKEAAEKEQKTKAEEAYREQVSQELQGAIINSLELGGLPKNEYTIGRMAFYMDSAIRSGYDVPIPELMSVIMPQVKSEYERDLRALLSSTPQEQLLSFLGDDVTKKTVKAHLEKTGAKKKAPVQQVAAPTQIASKEVKSPRDFFKRSWQK